MILNQHQAKSRASDHPESWQSGLDLGKLPSKHVNWCVQSLNLDSSRRDVLHVWKPSLISWTRERREMQMMPRLLVCEVLSPWPFKERCCRAASAINPNVNLLNQIKEGGENADDATLCCVCSPKGWTQGEREVLHLWWTPALIYWAIQLMMSGFVMYAVRCRMPLLQHCPSCVCYVLCACCTWAVNHLVRACEPEAVKFWLGS